MDIEKYINLNKKYYYSNLIKILDGDEKNFINDLLKETRESKKKLLNMNILSIEETEKTEDDYLYKKPWNKLNNIHKIIKIKEFINSKDISLENKNNLISKLTFMIKNKKLMKTSDVEYNSELMKIISIPCLSQENKNININTI
jgi:hypothetical protein